MDKLRRRMCSGAIIGAIGMMASVGAIAGEHLPKPVRHDVFACTQRTCAMPTSGAYPYLIIGRFKQAADTAQSQNLFKAMCAHHHWQLNLFRHNGSHKAIDFAALAEAVDKELVIGDQGRGEG